MERLLDLAEGLFQTDWDFAEFGKELELALEQVEDWSKDYLDELLETLAQTVRDAPKMDRLARVEFFWLLGKSAQSAGKLQTAYLAFDKALFLAESDSVRNVIRDTRDQLAIQAFRPYEDGSEALSDYAFLVRNLLESFASKREREGTAYERYSLSDELDFFEEFSQSGLRNSRQFWDFLRYVRVREALSAAEDRPLPQLELAMRFGLTTIELLVLMLLYNAVVDQSFEELMDSAWVDYVGPVPTVGMVDELFASELGARGLAARDLGPDGRLSRWGLVHILPPEGMELSPSQRHLLFLDDAVARFLQGMLEAPCPRLLRNVVSFRDEEAPPPADERLRVQVRNFLGAGRGLVFVHNPDRLQVELEVAAALREEGMAGAALFDLDLLGDMDTQLRRETIKSAVLGSRLLELCPVFSLARPRKEEEKRYLVRLLSDLKRVVSAVSTICVVEGDQEVLEELSDTDGLLYLEVRPPKGKEQVALWDYWIRKRRLKVDDKRKQRELAQLARVRLDPKRLLSRFVEGSELDFAELRKTVSLDLEMQFGFAARRVRPVFTWDDIVLPQETLANVNEIITFYRYRDQVLTRWGFARKLPYGKAISALFHGPPGTGKSMMAQVIARDLDMDVFRVDLSAILSKYVGETEKALRRVFDAAQESPTILVFDEADSLFTKRTEVRSSTDRYANVEVNYLLQKMEEFDGITILTTNNYGNIDEAFKRRIRFKIEFPMPDVDTREQLWRVMLPRDAELRGDVQFKTLAERYEFSPAHIKNAVLRAAFLAAERGEPIGQEDFEAAAEAEARELGQLVRRQN